MAELGIDQSKLPGVKEVCRDFAVLEDHTLAHSLQEQEIEHHLATNVQRNRLVQHDLQVARLLQEEEDRKAQAGVHERRKDRERQDCEIAQEIQVKLVIEAEQQRRRQEEDDEDVARILQQKLLREEKRRKKPPADVLLLGPCEKGFPPESRDRPRGSPGPETSACRGSPRPRRGDGQPRERRRGAPLVSEGLELEVPGSSAGRKAGGGRRHRGEEREPKPGSRVPAADPEGDAFDRGSSRGTDSRASQPGAQGGPRRPAGPVLDGELECADGGRGGSPERRERRPRSRERTRGLPPPSPDWEGEGAGLDCDRRCRKHQGRPVPGLERSGGPLSPSGAAEGRNPSRHRSHSRSPEAARRRPPQEGRPAPRTPHPPGLQEPEPPDRQGPRRGSGREQERAVHGPRALPRRGEDWETERGQQQRRPGTKSRGSKEAAYQKPRPASLAQEFHDAEIARKLQEEELLASQVDKRAAQVAQDEEIARLLMAEEKKAYKKAKGRGRGSLEGKRRDQDWKQDANERLRPRSREGQEPHRPRSDKPTRPPPPFTEDLDHRSSPASQHHSAHEASTPDPPHAGSRYKQ